MTGGKRRHSATPVPGRRPERPAFAQPPWNEATRPGGPFAWPSAPSSSTVKHPIVVIGSINTDLVARTRRVPAPGETVLGSDLLTVPGGKGANQAVAAARLAGRSGPAVHFVGRVGDDDAGTRLRDTLTRHHVDTTHLRTTRNAASGCAVILVDSRGQNSIVVSPGANARVSPADVDAALPLVRSAAAVLLQLEIPLATVRHALALCRRLGVRAILDPAPVPPRGLPRALFAADVLTPNEPESLHLAGAAGPDSTPRPRPRDMADRLLSRGARTAVLKLGPRGAAVATRAGDFDTIPPYRVRVVDTTAAGDAFNAALAVALSEGRAIKEAVDFANAAGALCCTKSGAQPSLPTRAAVDRLVRRGRRG